MNQARQGIGGAGTQTASLGFGGEPVPGQALTESWNGTNWTEVADLGTARYRLGGAGTNTAALAFGGAINPAGSFSAATEEWNDGPQVRTIDTD
jgi:hypothetical protein